MTEMSIIRASIASTYSALAVHAMESRVLGRYCPLVQGRITTAMRYLDSAREVLEGMEKEEQGKKELADFPP